MAQAEIYDIPHYPQSKDEAGPAFWKTMHNSVMAYPEKPTRNDAVNFGNYMKTWVDTFPCEECSESGNAYLINNPPPLKKGSTELQYYVCNWHNEIRQEQGKPTVDCEMVVAHKKGACTTCSQPTDMYDVGSALNGIKRVSRRIIDELSAMENVPVPKVVFQPCPSMPDAAGCTRLPEGIIFVNPKRFQLKSLVHEFMHYSLAYKGRSELEYSNEEEMDRMAYQIIDNEFRQDRGHYPRDPKDQEADYEDNEEQPALNNSIKHQDMYDMKDVDDGGDEFDRYYDEGEGKQDLRELESDYEDYPDNDGGGLLKAFEGFYKPISGLLKTSNQDLNEAHTPEVIGNLSILGAEYFLSPFGAVVASTLGSVLLMGYNSMAGHSMPRGDRKLITELSAHLLWNGIRYINPKMNGQAAVGAFSAGKAVGKGDVSGFLAAFTNTIQPEPEQQRPPRPVRSMPIEQSNDNTFLAESMATNPLERAGEQFTETLMARVFTPSTGH